MKIDWYRGVHWGGLAENGIWWAKSSRRRLLFGGDRIIYVALGRLRVRLMNPTR